jgi:hypothetical protein
LKHQTWHRGQGRGAAIDQSLPVKAHLDACQNAQERGLSHARGANEGYDLSARDVQVKILVKHLAAKGQAGDGQA